jgi:outer membrane protein
MKIQPIAVTAAAVLAISFSAAHAQTGARPAAAPPSNPPPQGPALPGVCVLSKEGAVYTSAAGRAMLARLDQLSSQADAEIKGQQTTLQTDAKALEGQRASLPADQFQQKGQALQARASELQRLAQLRNAELQATQKKALQTFSGYMDPIVRQEFTQHSCSVLLDANSLIYPAPAMDITGPVVQGLNGKIQSFPFDRERIYPNTGQPAAH